MKVLVTGAEGFLGRNLQLALAERGHAVLPVTRATATAGLAAALLEADAVIHLAGVNRPQDPQEFTTGNALATQELCRLLAATKRQTPVAFASSIQAEADTPYGRSKHAAEQALEAYGAATGSAVRIYRLPNVFGKWARPNYNSAVATFCHNLARGLAITVHDDAATLHLVHVDAVVEELVRFAEAPGTDCSHGSVEPVYQTTVGEVARHIRSFCDARASLVTPPVGTGFLRALYSTYVSYLPPADFSYEVERHADQRGVFVEVLKTRDSGQFSFFTAHPGVVRGGHYHHTKTEKFLVMQGRARFKFRNMATGETHAVETDGTQSVIVETVPGWSHDVTNIGEELLIVMLWANEIFDRNKPDTFSAKVF